MAAATRRMSGTATGTEATGTVPASPTPLPFRIINWIGIIDQLVGTQANRLLRPLDMPLPQFIMLNHFSHRLTEGKTVMSIARAMQQPQPGITKTVQKMLAKRWLREQANPEDGRSKVLFLTPAGLARHNEAVAIFARELAPAFGGWSPAELEQLFAQLDRLKIWLDDNR
ncbi:MarR family winged helix-turn-helix transcriptional regulator [Reyranella sp. CPCC 100927]|uniref:MarR family winged helix-turn-helix transcriptional regulator n=1 Tax=Reyranella sp. CPCC 100927 TaxID=2599616 RepID=UPI0011B706C2|nr:MarR family winged helix-turn-helix transcriptional regulator [Reyranella sp. CPCC 100927]TWT02864.1 winged helix-turn-helix transcriptional regulator [Reyranella sp. CPCC 100927]